jgi:hypothetical protein
MTHFKSISVSLLGGFSSSLRNKAPLENLPFIKIFFDGGEIYTGADTNHHLDILVNLPFSYIDYSHEFVGSALARFKRSTLPEHKGARTVVFRFLKIITPVKVVFPHYDD